ncbi:hypothetical protein FB45DRAFT_869485 [Roridomyces roridus]|uniref:Alcohol dehydrogenase-like C-terminal domain-containing protein n=1 Tax=Roridomyces roridus TaxID=1738132 RepID=A0AAD7BLG0_9AGAR|nr:hypothetical protein FB45DRAFT_869485 [Roridomyces roridus]
MQLTGGRGVDATIEAAGVPGTFELCQQIVAVGGTIANVGVHGCKVDLHLDKLWHKNIVIATSLIDATSTSTLLKLLDAGKINPALTAQMLSTTPHARLSQIDEQMIDKLEAQIRLLRSERVDKHVICPRVKVSKEWSHWDSNPDHPIHFISVTVANDSAARTK